MLTRSQSTKFNFEGERIYVGIDTHKKSWKVGIYHKDIALKSFSQEANPDVLVKYLNRNYPGAEFHCAYEAGFCGFWIQKHLSRRGINCIVVNPADVPTSHKEKEFKTDPRDCLKIARALRSNLLDPLYIPTDEGIESRHLVRLHHDMSKNYTRYKNKVKAILDFYGIEYPEEFSSVNNHWSKGFYNWLQTIKLKSEQGNWTLQFYIEECLRAKELKRQATGKVRELAKKAPYKKLVDLLRTIPGIGLVTAMKILTEIESIQRFKTLDKLCAYIGIIPSTNSSGEKERVGDITNRGNKFLKGAIVESAWMAIRYDPALLHTYLQLKNRMDGNKAIIRITRKLVARIMYVLINEKPYEVRKYV
jgi:transposase